MTPERFQIGDKLICNHESVFRDDVFTVVGHNETSVLATVTVFGRLVEVELDPYIMRLAHDPTAEKAFGRDKYDQIFALLGNDATKFACGKLNAVDMRGRSYADVFTVTREEVQDFVKIYNLPNKTKFSYPRKPKDGLFFYESAGKWFLFFGERGTFDESQPFDSFEEALPSVVDFLLKISGTGLY